MQPRFRHAAGDGWYAYDGKRWARDIGGLKVREAAKRWMELIYEAMQAVEGNNADDYSCLTKRNKLNSLVALIDTDEQLVCSPQAFDANSNLLNLQNGTLELDTLTFSAYFARVGHRFRAILGTRFTPSWAAISRTRAGWPTVSWSQA